jgi:hypothetical protein
VIYEICNLIISFGYRLFKENCGRKEGVDKDKTDKGKEERGKGQMKGMGKEF